MVLAQDIYPGQAIYHYGWYNAIVVALVIIAALQVRRLHSRGAVIAMFGAAIVVLAGVASGLMGPDTQLVVGAPGAGVRNDDAGGTFVFPLAADAPVELQRGNSVTAIGAGRRYTGGFVLWKQPRTVVYVDAADAKGNHLTITQPTNASFLSPVLLMQQATTIAGMDVNFDTFSVPAQRLTVRAVLFTPQQAALLRTDPPIVNKAAVLFQVSDTADRQVPGGIGVAASGQRIAIGGVLLRGNVAAYPAIVMASAPYLPVLILGLLALVAGAVLCVRPALLHPA
jgi:hypothetical protein